MQHVYDVEYEVYNRDAKSGSGFWENGSISILSNGDIYKAMRKAERAVLSEKVKPEKDKETGRWYCYRPHRVRVTKIERVRELAD